MRPKRTLFGAGRYPFAVVLAFWTSIVVTLAASGSPALAGGETWTPAVNISNDQGLSWFPSIAVDRHGIVHVVWASSRGSSDSGGNDSVMYSRWNGKTWSAPNDLGVSPWGLVTRNALATDSFGDLHLIYRSSIRLYYTTSPAEEALSAHSWQRSRRLSESDEGYLPAIAVDSKEVLHAVWTESTGACSNCYKILYKRSENGGQSWSAARTLNRQDADRNQLQLKIDSRDRIHVGWENLTPEGRHSTISYLSSLDGGQTWENRLAVSPPSGESTQMPTIGFDGFGNILLVYRTSPDDQVYYQVSADNGKSWSPPYRMTDFIARPSNLPSFDTYDMATDSAGNIHLVATGRQLSSDETVGVYHFEWKGRTWSTPHRITDGPGLVEHPRIAVNEGNRLHVVWFTRDNIWTQDGSNYEVWYSSGRASSPSVASSAPVTRPSALPTPTFLPVPTLTPIPLREESTIGLVVSQENPDTVTLGLGTAGSFLAVFLGVWLLQRRK